METPRQPEHIERITAIARDERRALMAIARAEGMDGEEALECMQDALCTFLARERTAAAATSDEHATASLKTMVRNAARNARARHRRKKPHDALDADAGLASVAPSAEDLVSREEDLVRLRLCVAELDGVARSVVLLRLLEERSGEDVAEALGLARGHVDVLVHRAKAALRACMCGP